MPSLSVQHEFQVEVKLVEIRHSVRVRDSRSKRITINDMTLEEVIEKIREVFGDKVSIKSR